jgi:ELWxxDGT repeat protein
MLPEIIPGPDVFSPRVGGRLVDLESVALFGVGEDDVGGALGVLWRTDGTAAGTFPVFGPEPYGVRPDLGGSTGVAAGPGRLFFRGRDASASSFPLVVTDGTVEGTHVLTNDVALVSERFFSRELDRLFLVDLSLDTYRLRIATSSGQLIDLPQLVGPGWPRGFTEFGNEVFFAEHRSDAPDRLWRSDGTAAGTVPFFEDLAAIGPPIAGDQGLYFGVADPEYPEWLWRSDGTAEGTEPFVAMTGLRGLVAVLGPRLVFLRAYDGGFGQELWVTDGTPEGTFALTHYSSPTDPQQRFAVSQLGDRLLIAGGREGPSFQGDRYRELRITDGTEDGTVVLVSCPEHCIPVSPTPGAAFGRGLFMRIDAEHGREPWETDGTLEGTRLIADLCPGPCDGDGGLIDIVEGAYIFVRWSPELGQPTTDAELLWSEGPGTTPVPFTDFGPDQPFPPGPFRASIGNRVVLLADDGIHGRELWVSEIAPREPTCVEGPTTLCLGEGRFRLEVTWRDFTGGTGAGHAEGLTSDTGTFWFFDPANVELIVKVLDARSINGFYWVYYGALSNVGYDLVVTDTVSGASKAFHNPAGGFASQGDIEALPGGGATAPRSDGLRGALPSWTVAAAPDLSAREGLAVASSRLPSWADRTFGTTSTALRGEPCVESGTRLCLADGRFAVEVSWRDFSGGAGEGRTLPLTSDTGSFWFFDAANVELVIKVLDARAINGRFWVYYGALSNVEYTITVTDTETGATRSYQNPSGRFASAGDTEAF